MHEYRGKRLFDFIVASIILILLLPLLMISAILVRVTSPGPVFFVQDRVGRYSRVFRVYKFRSMRENTADPIEMGQVDLDNDLITLVGRYLRRFKIDELPQLWNIVRGEMSLVGPRPTLPELAADYTPEQNRRLLVRPGLTGWAQVLGNTELTWDERIKLDLWYLDRLSFRFDLKILFLTFKVIIYGERVEAEVIDATGIRRSS
jgi:lipopolysaccharide/colanic/teichoic acid biosynthesis glycosyltransferase